MLYELSSCEVITLRAACVEAAHNFAESSESSGRIANNQRWSDVTRTCAARCAKWSQERAADFEAVSKALDEGREITTLAQAKEALER